MSEEEEEWRAYEPFGGWYEVSSHGRVRSWRNGRYSGRRETPRIMSAATNKTTGYQMVNLRDLEGKQRCKTVHSLVAESFIGPRPEGLEIRHLNGIKADCRASNLVYGTKKENAADRVLHGTQYFGEGHPQAKLNRDKARAIRVLWDSGQFSYKMIGDMFDVCTATVRDVIAGTTWQGRGDAPERLAV